MTWALITDVVMERASVTDVWSRITARYSETTRGGQDRLYFKAQYDSSRSTHIDQIGQTPFVMSTGNVQDKYSGLQRWKCFLMWFWIEMTALIAATLKLIWSKPDDDHLLLSMVPDPPKSILCCMEAGKSFCVKELQLNSD